MKDQPQPPPKPAEKKPWLAYVLITAVLLAAAGAFWLIKVWLQSTPP
jgi:hypothetical protein